MKAPFNGCVNNPHLALECWINHFEIMMVVKEFVHGGGLSDFEE
jgi:hypothetical protein